MSALTTRLAKLELFMIPRPGCDLCRHWDPLTICNDSGECLRPETCPECKRVVPIEERRVFVGIDLELI